MEYYKQVICPNGSILSIDNVRVNFIVDEAYSQELLSYLGFELHWFAYPIDMRDFKYRHLTKATYANGSTMTCGFQFNGNNPREDAYKGFLDFNPNKTGSDSLFWRDLAFIRSCSRHWDIDRVDIAYDVPVPRQSVILVKDGRKYSVDAYSLANRTEYLGIRSNINFVKVYNKSLESSLDYDLTRIEVTCKPSPAAYLSAFPEIYCLDNIQVGLDFNELTQSNLAILNMELALLASHSDPGLMIFNSLGKDLKKKLKPYLLPESSRLVVLGALVSRVLDGILEDISK